MANDGGHEDIVRVAQAFGTELVNLPARSGSYAARNAALACARGEYIAFLDANIVAPPEWLRTGLHEMRNASYVGGPILIEASNHPTPAVVYQQLTAFKSQELLQKHGAAPTANLFVHRRVIQELGNFDSRLQSGGDLEFGNRVSSSGKFRQSFCPALTVYHPPRTFREIHTKIARVQRGSIDLYKLYPGRFASNRLSSKKAVAKLISPLIGVFRSRRVRCSQAQRALVAAMAVTFGVTALVAAVYAFLVSERPSNHSSSS